MRSRLLGALFAGFGLVQTARCAGVVRSLLGSNTSESQTNVRLSPGAVQGRARVDAIGLASARGNGLAYPGAVSDNGIVHPGAAQVLSVARDNGVVQSGAVRSETTVQAGAEAHMHSGAVRGEAHAHAHPGAVLVSKSDLAVCRM